MTQMKEDKREVALIDYIDVVVKWKWLIAVVTLMCLVSNQLYSPSQPIWHSAKALIYVATSQAASTEGKATEVALPTLSPAFYRSIALADEVRLKMEVLRTTMQDSMGLDSAPMGMHVNIVEQTGMELEVRSTASGLPVRLVNAWTDTFMSLSQGLSATELGSMHQSVAAQFDSAKIRLHGAEERLEGFDGGGQIGFLKEKLAAYQRQIADLLDTVVSRRLLLVTMDAELARAREVVSALEVNGEALHTLEPSQRNQLIAGSVHPLARQMLEVMEELDSLFTTVVVSDARGDRDATVEAVRSRTAGLQLAAKGYGDAGTESTLQQLLLSDSLWAVQQALAKHLPTIQLQRSIQAEILRHLSEDEVLQTDVDQLRQMHISWDPIYQMLREKEARYSLALAATEHQLSTAATMGISAYVEDHQRALENVSDSLRINAGVSDRIAIAQDMLVEMRNRYQDSRRKMVTLVQDVLALRAEVRNLEKGMSDLQVELQTVAGRLNRLTLEGDRLMRTRETLRTTHDRLEKLTEEARIAAQIASANLRIITRAVTPVSDPAPTRRSALLAGAVGVIFSVFVAFLVEYVRKARVKQIVIQC